MWNNFHKDLPYIVGGLFSTISEAMKLIPTVKGEITGKKRMADFTVWGEAIARVLGHEPFEFVNAYEEKMMSFDEVIVQNHIVGELLVQFIKVHSKWEGSPTGLLKELRKFAKENEIDIQSKGFPKPANSLSRTLNVIKTKFTENGYNN